MSLILRRMTPEDFLPLHELLSDGNVMAFLEPAYNREQTAGFLEKAGLSDPPRVLAVERDGCFAGYAIWHKYEEGSMEIGWVLSPVFWGQGIATELTRILTDRAHSMGRAAVIECVPAQAATRHIAEKAGFRPTGNRDGLLVFRKDPPEPGRAPEGPMKPRRKNRRTAGKDDER